MKYHSLLAITVAFVVGGCAHNYDPPTATYYKAGTIYGADTIEYQTLRRGDFKATTPPNAGIGKPEAASAALVAAVNVAPESEFAIVPLKSASDSTRFEATVHKLRFHAIMDRNKSWWRSEIDSKSTAEVLEHEQIHFAIYEVAARDLNARLPEIAARIRSTGQTADEARSAAKARLESELHAARQRTAQRQSEFDKDTSNGMDRKRQKEWWDRIQAELVEH